MDRSAPPQIAAGDRLSKLDDALLGHILSFLPAREAARAAVLSSRWRDIFAAVHTVSLEETRGHHVRKRVKNYHGWKNYVTPIFSSVVTAALLSRHRRGRTVPLRALRISMMPCLPSDASDSIVVDQWVSYAVHQAAPGLEIDLRLHCSPVCRRGYSLHGGGTTLMTTPDDHVVGQHNRFEGSDSSRSPARRHRSRSPSPSCSEDEDTADEKEDLWRAPEFPWMRKLRAHTIPGLLFSCAELRSLSLGHCRLDSPATVSLPSVETLLLSHVKDPTSNVQRLVSGCPRLADLTLEACPKVTALAVLGARLRRLALRCCHDLATVAVDASEMQVFEYRGAVPDSTFLAMHGGAPRGIAYCKVDICGAEATSEKELTDLRQFLQLFADDDALTAATTILERAPSLEVLSLVFHPHGDEISIEHIHQYTQEELDDAHHLKYNPHAVLAVPLGAMIPCLRSSKLREINLVHYQGGLSQRTLAKLLLCNAPAIAELCCVLAEGPFWMQIKLKQEIQDWVMNKSAKIIFA